MSVPLSEHEVQSEILTPQVTQVLLSLERKRLFPQMLHLTPEASREHSLQFVIRVEQAEQLMLLVAVVGKNPVLQAEQEMVPLL